MGLETGAAAGLGAVGVEEEKAGKDGKAEVGPRKDANALVAPDADADTVGGAVTRY